MSALRRQSLPRAATNGCADAAAAQRGARCVFTGGMQSGSKHHPTEQPSSMVLSFTAWSARAATPPAGCWRRPAVGAGRCSCMHRRTRHRLLVWMSTCRMSEARRSCPQSAARTGHTPRSRDAAQGPGGSAGRQQYVPQGPQTRSFSAHSRPHDAFGSPFSAPHVAPSAMSRSSSSSAHCRRYQSLLVSTATRCAVSAHAAQVQLLQWRVAAQRGHHATGGDGMHGCVSSST